MEITAKITYLIRNNHVATAKQLCKQYSPAVVNQTLIRYGMANQENVVCQLAMEDRSTHQLTTGYYLVKDLINIINTNQFDITQMIPYAAFDDSYSIAKIIDNTENNLSSKIGEILPRKLRTRQNKKQIKQVLVKKPSQTTTNVSQKMKNNKLNNLSLKAEDDKGRTEKKNIKQTIKIQTKVQRPKVQQMKNQVVKQPKKADKKSLKVESGSQDEQKILASFKIDAQTEKNQKLQPVEENKIEEELPKPQVVSTQEKQENLEQDFEDAFEALLKNKKIKAENKIQNKNLNLPDKLEKKTTEKVTTTQKSTNMPVKPSQNQVKSSTPKMSGQTTLFGFMNKK